MENQNRRSYYNNYSPMISNNNIYSMNNNYLRSPINNRDNQSPSYLRNPQSYTNKSNIYPPNYPSPNERNASLKLYDLNYSNDKDNNNRANDFSPKYTESTTSSNQKYYYSPIQDKTQKNKLQSEIPNYSNYSNYNSPTLTKNKSSPYLSINRPQKFKKKTLILDLDETLVHSGFNPFTRKSDITLTIYLDGKEHVINVLKRPHVDEFLREISEYYEIIVFTASISEYASPLLDQLDKNNYVSGRLFRQDCSFNHGLYIKDLRRIGKDLKDMIIIDNNPVSYAVNEDNGIPILTWYDDLTDKELIKLLPLLKYLADVDDVRPVINQIVNKRTNEVDFYMVNNIINNKKYENGLNKNISINNNQINYELLRKRYNNEYNDINNRDMNRDAKINEDRYRNYINNNNLYQYNNRLNSFSNMSFNEIQNEGHLNNYNNNYDEKNNYNDRINENNNDYYNQRFYNGNNDINDRRNTLAYRVYRNKEILSEEKKNLLHRYNNENNDKNQNLQIVKNENINIINNKGNYNFDNRLRDKRAHTPNINAIRKNIYYNNGNSYASLYNNPSRENEQNIQRINDQNDIRNNRFNNNNFNNRSTSDLLIPFRKINDIKVNNYFRENTDNRNNSLEKSTDNETKHNFNDYYLRSYNQHLLRTRARTNNISNYNIKTDLSNNNENERPYYSNYRINNSRERNSYYDTEKANRNDENIYQNRYNINNDRNDRNIYENRNILNNDRNDLNNSRNNYYYQNNNIDKDREHINYLIRKYNNEAQIEDNKNIYLQREKKIEETNTNQRENSNDYYERLKNYSNINEYYQNFLKRNLNNPNNYYSTEYNNTKNKELPKDYIKDRFNNESNNLNRTLSDKNYLTKSFSPNKNINRNEIYDRYYVNSDLRDENNLRTTNLKNDFNSVSYKNLRTETEIPKNKHINYMKNFGNDNKYEENLNNRSIVLNKNLDKYKDEINGNNTHSRSNLMMNSTVGLQNNRFNINKYDYLKEISRTEEREFPPVSNYNLFRRYHDNKSDSPIRENYNNISVNNFNYYSSLKDKITNKNIDNNNENRYHIKKYKKEEDEDENENGFEITKIMNKSSSYFNPRTIFKSLLSSEDNENKEKSENENKDRIYGYQQKYYYRNDNKNK